jgi:hypothetical protein
VLRDLGGTVFEEDSRRNVDRILAIHSRFWTLDERRQLRILVSSPIEVTDELKKKMKGTIKGFLKRRYLEMTI